MNATMNDSRVWVGVAGRSMETQADIWRDGVLRARRSIFRQWLAPVPVGTPNGVGCRLKGGRFTYGIGECLVGAFKEGAQQALDLSLQVGGV